MNDPNQCVYCAGNGSVFGDSVCRVCHGTGYRPVEPPSLILPRCSVCDTPMVDGGVDWFCWKKGCEKSKTWAKMRQSPDPGLRRFPRTREEIGRLMRELRGERGIKQDELAERVGMDQSAISHIEGGLRLPSVTRIADLLEALDMELVIVKREEKS